MPSDIGRRIPLKSPILLPSDTPLDSWRHIRPCLSPFAVCLTPVYNCFDSLRYLVTLLLGLRFFSRPPLRSGCQEEDHRIHMALRSLILRHPPAASTPSDSTVFHYVASFVLRYIIIFLSHYVLLLRPQFRTLSCLPPPESLPANLNLKPR